MAWWGDLRHGVLLGSGTVPTSHPTPERQQSEPVSTERASLWLRFSGSSWSSFSLVDASAPVVVVPVVA
jgi:hypothetical protein